jgi:hypothetical protein
MLSVGRLGTKQEGRNSKIKKSSKPEKNMEKVTNALFVH